MEASVTHRVGAPSWMRLIESAYSDRQLAFCRDREEREREDRKRAVQENFNLSVQQYGQDWITAGMYGAEIQRDAQWEAYGDMTQGMVSATFQQSLVETSQLGRSLREEELSFHSNGATELSSQQRRSHSRVSSLIRAFNSDGHRDAAGVEDNIRERDDGTSWDKSALMSIQRELSEFSYQQNFNHHFHPVGPFSCRDPNFYSSEAESVAQMSHSYMRSSQTKHIISAQANCNSNFFIHSEFSPFQLWRDYNRFPFQQAEVSGFMHYSEFPKWYQTPMYNELSLENQAHSRHRDIRQPRNHLGYPVPLTAPRSTSTSSQVQRASAVEKRCESELAVHHPQRKWTQRLGTNKLPPHRPSTASPSTEMSRRVRDTISSVKALQQKVKMMSEYDTTNQQETFSRNESWFTSGTNTLTAEMNIVSSNKANSFRIGQQLTPSVQKHQDVDTSGLHKHEVSPQPVEHPPVRAESRGATPDVRMSSYRSRATSLLFNLKDNRKRVKSTYSPTKFKGLDTAERNQQPYGQEPHESALTSSDVHCLQTEPVRSTNAAINQYHTPGLSLTAQTSHSTRVNSGHYSENTVNDYQVAQMQSHGSGFSGFVTSNYSNNQLLGNGQNLNKCFASFTPYRQDIYGSADEVKQSYSAEDTSRLSVDNIQHREHLIGKVNATQGGVFVKADKYDQLKENTHNYKNVSSQDNWRQASVQDTENIHLKTNVPPMKHETESLVERLKQENLHGGEKEEVKDANLRQNYNRFTDQYGRGQQNTTSDKTMDIITTGQTKLNIPAPNEKIQTKPRFEKKNQPNPTFIEKNTLTVAMTNQVKNMQTVDTKCEQVMASHRKPQYHQAEMTKTQQKEPAEPPKIEIAKFISSRQPALETVKMQELQNVRQVKDDHIIEGEERKNEQKEKARDTYFHQEEEKQTTGEKERVLKPTDEPTNVTEKVPKKLKTEQAEKEKLKEEHEKTKLAKTEAPEQVRIDQVKHEQANGVQAEKKQQSTEKAEGEQMYAEKINMENVKEEQIRGKQREQIKDLQTKTIDVKRMGIEVLEVKTDHMKVEDVREGRDEKDSSHACHINLEKATSCTGSTEDTRGEKTKLEENLEQKESEQSKTENLLERSAKFTAKLAPTQQARQEPDRVEQVKIELARAKTELPKTKEKMRGEQKQKVRNIIFTKEEGLLKNDDSNTGENARNKEQNHPLETQTHAVTDDYERLREKYGFTYPTSANSTKLSAVENNEQAKEHKVEIGNNLTSIDRPCVSDSFLTPETANKEGGRNFKHSNETVQESDCNEPLNKPHLGSAHSFLTNLCDKANTENVSDKLKDDSGQKSEKNDVIKDKASLQKESVSAKHERKLIDQRIDKGKDMAVAPLRALSQREKAQTKQEILTSKIKAHAEKEISAIKEKGFALPEGFMGKSSAMLSASGQSVNIRQRPSSQEVPKKHETTVSNKITTKHQLEPSGVQKEPDKSASSLSSDTVDSEAAVDHSEKSTKTILPTGTSVSTTNICVENKQNEENHTETFGRLSGEMQQVENDETLTKTKGIAQASGISKPVTAEAAKEEAHKDSESEDCVTQNESSVRDDSVQIMGIMVTVVERNPTVNSSPQNNNTENQTNSVKAESNTSDSGRENSSLEEAKVLVKATDSKKSPGVMKENEDSLEKNNYSDNVKEILNGKEMNREISAENADLQLSDCATIAELQKKRQPEAGFIPSKDKVLAKTQPVLRQMDTTREETKDVSVNMPKENWSETSGHPEAGDKGSQHEMQKPFINEISHDKIDKAINDQPMNDNMKTFKNISKSSNNDGQCAAEPEDNTCPFSPPSPFNDSCVDNTRMVSQSHQSTETFSKEHNQEVTSVHIDNIAVRVVPSASKTDNVDMLEKCPMKAVPPNAGFVSEQNQVVTSSSEGKLQISNHGHHFENLIHENSEQKMKDSLEEKLAVQYVLSSVRKLSDSLKENEKQNNVNTTRESIKAGDKKSESSVQMVEADYFQVQGPAETSNTSPANITAGKDLKVNDVLKLLPNETFIGTELQSDVFVFTVDPSEKKTDQSSSEIIDGKNLTSEDLETGDDTVTSKQPGGSMESWNKIINLEASQSNPTRTYDEVNQLESCATERQNSGNQNLTNTHSEAKPNPRERVSAIPEISAIADYARLKVIVSEDKEEQPLQQFPPNKKEGFFPLIQTRHSRRPVFTDYQQDHSVKTQSLSSKTEITATVNKESKSLVFPIMEREHQRTGMFKLGDKERQEKTPLNAQMTVYADKDPNQIDSMNSPIDKTELVAHEAEEHQWRTVEEQQTKATHEVQWRGSVEEQYRRTAQQAQQSIAEKEQQRTALHEKQQRRVAEEQQRRIEEAEQKRKAAYEEQQRKAAEEQRRQAAKLEQQRRITEEEQQRKALHEEQQRIAEEQQRRIEEEEQKRKAAYEEQQRRVAEEQRENEEEEQKRKAAYEEQQRRVAEEQRKKMEKEEQKRKAAYEEQQRRVAEEQRKKMEEEEQKRKAAYEEQQRRVAEEQRKKMEKEEQKRKAAYEEQQRRVAEEQRKKMEKEEQKRKAAYEEQQRRVAEEQRKKMEEEEQKRKAAYEEQRRKAAKEQQRRAAQLEQQRRIAEEQQRKAAHEEQQRRLAEEQQMRITQLEQRQRIAKKEQQRRAAEEEQRKIVEEQRKKAAHEEQQRRKVEEQQRRAAVLEQKRRITEEEEQRKAAEQQKIAEDEQRRKSAYDEQQKKAAEEKQRRITEEEQRKMAAHEEQQRREMEEHQKMAAQLVQQRRTAEEQHRKAAHEEQQRRAAERQQLRASPFEQQRRTAEEQQQRIASPEKQHKGAGEEQQKRAAQIDLHRRTAEEEPTRQDAHKVQQRREAEVQQRRIAKEEQQTKTLHEQSLAVEEQLKRTGQLEQERRLREGPQMRKAAEEDKKGRTVQEQKRETEQEQRRAPQSPNDRRRKATELNQRYSQLEHREKERQTAKQDKQRREIEEEQKELSQEDKQRMLSAEEQKRGESDEQERKAIHEQQQRRVAQKEQKQSDVEEHRKRLAQKKQQRIASLIEEQRQVKPGKEQIVGNTEKETIGKTREGINVFISEKESVKQTQELNKIQHLNEVPMNESLVEEEKTASQKMLKNDYIAAEKEEIVGEQRLEKHFKQENAKDLTPTKTDNDSQADKMEDDEQVTSLNVKARDCQEMDKGTAQKMNALQYFAITSTNRERISREKQLSPQQQQKKKQEELESPNDFLNHRHYRPHAAVSPAPTLPRSNTSSPAPGAKPLMFRVKDNTMRGSSLTKSIKPRFHKNFGEDFSMGSTFDGASDKAEDDQEIVRRNAGTPFSRFAAISESSLQDYSNTIPHMRPYSRRSVATDDDESRSVISSMSEDVESFATSAADLTDMHGLFDFDRPESACSFSSDVSRSLGKPPAVPPKSEKALRRAQRLTSRRMKKELSKAAEGNPVGLGKEVSSFPSSSSSSNEVCSSKPHVVASPHFSPPVAFALAPATGSSLPSSHKDRKSSHYSFHASPHATGPISIPSPSPHARSVVSLHASSPASKPAALQTVAHVSSSPTLHHVNHPATPMTQYHVESTNYPLTQRKVLQDLGSGQFFVVDVPVQVKTKTFFDPETGKYVQLNVRQTGQNISQPQLHQKHQQSQGQQQQLPVNQQSQSLSSVTTVASKPFRFYQGQHSSPQNYQAAVVNSVHESSSSVPAALHQSQQASRENHSCRTPVPEIDQNSEGHRYSPEKTPYMDTVNDITKTYNLVNSTRDSCNTFPECDTNSPLGRSSVCENDHSANLEYQPRDIIAISELEDFMEVSDW
ncbi:uncharacterized protein LOC129360046 isoform X2 [Poeciliopsis prolifica]|uniref:uncharacterized protein LOC129360046 isoform X2 n=1 Tax=Poeciliopsis prolifica TaxID=188132 RepID=UPI00241308E6|nr:uncharacterized protein LOC129360046 isoform X2 [Poeciliopsis prolifica]